MMTILMMIPIEMTLVGIVTDVSDEHPINAELPNDMVVVSVNATVMIVIIVVIVVIVTTLSTIVIIANTTIQLMSMIIII